MDHVPAVRVLGDASPPGACCGGLGDAGQSPAGQRVVPVDEVFPLDRAQDAYERFAAGGKFGKIVLCV